jgi:hypothetical protein
MAPLQILPHFETAVQILHFHSRLAELGCEHRHRFGITRSAVPLELLVGQPTGGCSDYFAGVAITQVRSVRIHRSFTRKSRLSRHLAAHDAGDSRLATAGRPLFGNP